MKKRILSILLALAMVLSVMPFSVFATEGEAGEETTEVSYASGLEDTASYAMKIPDEVKKNGTTTYYHTDCGNGHDIPAVEIDGEWFLRFGQKTFQQESINVTIRAPKFTYGYTGENGAPSNGVPESIPLNETTYIALRIKSEVHDAEAFEALCALFRPFIYGKKAAGGTYQVSFCGFSKAEGKWPFFYDLTDGSMTSYASQSGWWEKRGYELSGEIDGYLMYPIKNLLSSISLEDIRTGLSGIQFFFDDKAGTASCKEANWDKMDLLVGDCFFVENPEAFQAARNEANGLTQYKNADGSWDMAAVRPNSSFARGWFVHSSIGKNLYTMDKLTATNSGMNQVHKYYLGDGEVGYKLVINNAFATTGMYSPTTQWTYDGSQNITSEFEAVTGVPQEVPLDKMTHIAVRVAMKGGLPNQETRLLVWTAKEKTWLKNGDVITLIDKTTGQASTTTVDDGVLFYGDFDGYMILPFPTNGVISHTETGLKFLMRRGWENDRAAYIGDSYFIEDIDMFYDAHRTPSAEYTATNDSITINDVEEGALYSIDGETWNSTGVFTGLEKDAKYTLSAKYDGGALTYAIEAWTSPFSTHVNDASNYMMLLKETGFFCSNNGGYVGWGSSSVNKVSTGAYGNGTGAGFFVVEKDGELFIEMDYNEESGGDANSGFNVSAFSHGDNTFAGVHPTVDASNAKYFAFRVKVEALTEAAKLTTSMVSLYNSSGFEGQTHLVFTDAILVDYKTREVVENKWASSKFSGMQFEGEFDGWVVVDIDKFYNNRTKTIEYTDAEGNPASYTVTAKEWFLGTKEAINGEVNSGYLGFQPWFHNRGEGITGTCSHLNAAITESDWRDKVLYMGNILIVDDIDVFGDYYTSCDVHGHILEAGEVTAPTCTEQGYTTYECTRCDYTENKDYTEATGHTHTAVETAPTCTEAGYTTYTCACGDSYKVDGEAALGHEIEVLDEQAATCTEAGYREEMCLNCDYYDVIDIEATGHIYETEESVVDVAPTCTEAGYTKYICDICGDDSVVVPGDAATGHNFVAGEKVPATPSAQGYTVYTCENCGATENRDFVDYVEPSNKVTGVTVTPTDIGFRVTWDAFEGATGYYVRVRNSENTTNIANRDVGNVTEYEYKLGVNGFNASYDEEYIIQVIAYVGNVYQKYADADKVVSQMVITNRVVDVKATPYGHGAKVTFRPVEGANKYWVYVRNAADDSAVYTTSTTTTEVTVVNNMIGGTEYYVQVVAFNGNTQLDKRANAIKAKFTAPYVLPSKYNVAASTPTTFSITWDAVAGATTYFVQVRTEDDAPVRTVTVSGKTIAAVAMYSDASKLSANTTYKFRIAATINGVTTGYGDWMTYTTGDYEPVTVTAEHNTETGKVKIAWTDLADSHAVYLYRIDAEGNRKYFKYLENGETSYTIKAPASGTYSYGVVTVQRNMSGDCYNPIAVSEQIIFG